MQTMCAGRYPVIPPAITITTGVQSSPVHSHTQSIQHDPRCYLYTRAH
jgi:hypothetical protein